MTREAVETDGAALAELVYRSPQAGRMIVAQARLPDFFARRRQLDRAVTLVTDGPAGIDATASVGLKTVEVDRRPLTAAYVLDLAVDEQARRKGRARELLTGAHDWAAAHGADLAYAHIMADNQPSLRAFSAVGYREAARVRVRVMPARGSAEVPAWALPASAWDAAAWQRAADLLAESGGGHDLRRLLDGPGLRALWHRLAGWRAEDVWLAPDALLGLWDHSAVSRAVLIDPLPLEARALDAAAKVGRALGLRRPLPAAGRPMPYGLLLGGAGATAPLRGLLRVALARALDRGVTTVLAASDDRRRPRWTRRVVGVDDHLHVVAHPLRGSPAADLLGRRPLWPDPLDL